MPVIFSLIPDIGMKTSDLLSGLPSVASSFCLPGKSSLCSSESREGVLQVSRVRKVFLVTGGQEVLYPHIDAYGGKSAYRPLRLRKKTAYFHVPLLRLPRKGQCPDLRSFGKRAVLFDPYHADMLNTKSISEEPDAVSVGKGTRCCGTGRPP